MRMAESAATAVPRCTKNGAWQRGAQVTEQIQTEIAGSYKSRGEEAYQLSAFKTQPFGLGAPGHDVAKPTQRLISKWSESSPFASSYGTYAPTGGACVQAHA